MFTCTWLIDSGTRERVEQEERSCNLGGRSHRKATQLVTTTIVEEYETYRIDIVESDWTRTSGYAVPSTHEDTVLQGDLEGGGCRGVPTVDRSTAAELDVRRRVIQTNGPGKAPGPLSWRQSLPRTLPVQGQQSGEDDVLLDRFGDLVGGQP